MPDPKPFADARVAFWSRSLGSWEAMEVHDGTFRLDGGAMFGVVPRILWERLIPPDDQHRIPLALRCLLLRGHDRLALIDTGIGKKWSARERGMYAIDDAANDMARSLARWGVGPGDVTDVLLTHLHFDHAGGNTVRDADGAVRPFFPNATYHVNAANLAHARDPAERDHPSYIPENYEPLVESGQMVTFEDGAEVLPGITAVESDGHTPGLVTFRVEGGDATLVYCADLIPTASHLKLNYVMGYDLCPRTTMLEKKQVLEPAVDGNWILYFEHDPEIAAATIEVDAKGRYSVRERLFAAD